MIAERLYLITDRHVAEGRLLGAVRAALQAAPRGSVLVQLRDKDMPRGERAALAAALRAITAKAGARLLVNGDAALADAVGADGVHLPDAGGDLRALRQRLGAERLAAASTHSAERAIARAGEGAGLVTLGPIWSTPSKAEYGEPLGTSPLAAARAGLDAAGGRCALVALGGVDGPARAAEAVRAGAHAVAVVRAVLAVADPGAAAVALIEAVEAARRPAA